MKRSIFNSFQFRLTLLTVLAVTLTGLAVLFHFSVVSATRIRREGEQNLAQAALALADNVSSWEEKAIFALANLSRQPDIISMQAERQEPVLIAYTTIYNYIYLASTANLEGINIARSDGDEPKDYHDRLWFQGAAAGNELTRQTLIGRTSGEPALCHSTPVHDEGQDIIGVVMACADLTDLTEAVGATKVGETGFTFLVDEQGQILAHPHFVAAGELIDLSAYPPVEALLAGQVGLVTFKDEQGVEWLAEVTALTNGWGVVAQQTRAEVMGPVWINLLMGMLVVGLAVVAGSGITWFLTKRMVAPFNDLTETAGAFAQGEFDRRLAVTHQDELGVLAGSFNTMADQLQMMLGRISARTKRLENTVALNESLSGILEVDKLFVKAIQQLKIVLGYDHIDLYQFTEDHQSLILTESSREARANLEAEHYAIPVTAPDSLVARAARTNQVMWIEDIQQAADWSPTFYLETTRAEAAVPIEFEGQVVAVLDVQVNQVGALDDDEANLLRSVANQMAIAMRNAHLFVEVEQALADARRLQERYTQQAWDKSRIANQERRQLYVQPAAPDLSPAKREAARRRAAHERKPALVAIDGLETGAKSIVAPVVLGNNTIGTMQLHHLSNNPQIWTAEDLAIVEAVLDQVAQSAENLRLFDETRKRADYERAVGEITQQLREAPNIETLTKIAAESVSQVLKVSGGVVDFNLVQRETNGKTHNEG